MGMREEFEAWMIETAERFHPDLTRRGEHVDAEYQNTSVQCWWDVWQASRAALVVTLPDRGTYEYDAGYTVYDLCAQAITDAGVSYK